MERGITAGTFDLLHSGHIMMLEEAKRNCDHLTVALQTDPSSVREGKNKPVQTTYERFIQLKFLSLVDDVIVYDTEEDYLTILSMGDWNVRFIGEEYRDTEFTGKGVVPEHYNKRQHEYSSTTLRQRVYEAEKLKKEK